MKIDLKLFYAYNRHNRCRCKLFSALVCLCRYEAGLQKLLAAEGEVNVMKEELIQLQPKLIATGKQVEETLVVVNSQTEAAVAQKAVVSAEEAAASEKAAAAKAIKVRRSCHIGALTILRSEHSMTVYTICTATVFAHQAMYHRLYSKSA